MAVLSFAMARATMIYGIAPSLKNFPVDGKIKSRHIVNAVMRQSGIDKKF